MYLQPESQNPGEKNRRGMLPGDVLRSCRFFSDPLIAWSSPIGFLRDGKSVTDITVEFRRVRL